MEGHSLNRVQNFCAHLRVQPGPGSPVYFHVLFARMCDPVEQTDTLLTAWNDDKRVVHEFQALQVPIGMGEVKKRRVKAFGVHDARMSKARSPYLFRGVLQNISIFLDENNPPGKHYDSCRANSSAVMYSVLENVPSPGCIQDIIPPPHVNKKRRGDKKGIRAPYLFRTTFAPETLIAPAPPCTASKTYAGSRRSGVTGASERAHLEIRGLHRALR